MAAPLHPAVTWRRELIAADVDPTAKLVGLVLAQYLDTAGRAQVARSTLATACGFASVDTVKRAVRRLEVAELLGVDRALGGGRTPNRYQARSGCSSAPPNGSVGAVAPPQGVLQRPIGGAPEHRELEGQKEHRAPASAREAAAAFRERLQQAGSS